MQSPIVQQASNTLVLDLVSQFFSKLLGKDNNYPHYLKHWVAFRELLSIAPFNIDSSLSYISTMDLHNLHGPSHLKQRPSQHNFFPLIKDVSMSSTAEDTSNSSIDTLEESTKQLTKVVRHRTNSANPGISVSSTESSEKDKAKSY